jgi:hypothetical protein
MIFFPSFLFVVFGFLLAAAASRVEARPRIPHG